MNLSSTANEFITARPVKINLKFWHEVTAYTNSFRAQGGNNWYQRNIEHKHNLIG